ncbi:hypothetical protein [Ekhidna sp.]|uniref:hypothetical protein n=1 Tax=Ekhidna sp. TaxID=2608089 RepID=UPI0032984B5C
MKKIGKNKLIKTLLDLFRDPARVLDSKDDSYLNGLAYTSSVTGIIFFFILFLDKFLFQESLIGNNWRLPERLQFHHSIVDNVYDDFYGFILTAGIFPGVLLAVIIFYINKKPLQYLINVSFYAVTQMLLVVSPFLVLNYLFDWDVDTIAILAALIFHIYFFIKLGINHWGISILKSIGVVTGVMLGFILFEHPLEAFFVGIMERPEKVYDLNLDDRSHFIGETKIDSDIGHLREVFIADSICFYSDGLNVIGSFEISGARLWEKWQDLEISKTLLIKNTQILCIVQDTSVNGKTQDLIKGFTYSGQEVFSFLLDDDRVGRSYKLLSSDENSFELFIPNKVGIQEVYDYKKGLFSKKPNSNWDFETIELFKSKKAISDMTQLEDGSFVGSTSETDGWQFASFGLLRMDSSYNTTWSTSIYDKKNPYDPRVPSFQVVNEKKNEVITHYSIANDTIVFSYIQAFDLTSGKKKWENEFAIPADFTEYFQMKYDDQFLYIVGESHMNIRKYFWQPTFHAGMICKVSLEQGALISFKHFGTNSFGAHTRISDLIIDDSSIRLFGVEHFREGLFHNMEYPFSWEILKEDI